jgi:hypothetical protein
MHLRRIATLTSLTLALTASAAHADAPEEDKDPEKAFQLSAGGVAVSAALVATPFLLHDQGTGWGVMSITVGLLSSAVTPALGHFYAGERWTKGMTLRAWGLGAAVASFGLAVGSLANGSGGSGPSSAFVVGMVGAGGLYIVGTVDDLSTASAAARAANAHHLTVAPTLVGTGADRHLGLGLAGTF